MASREFVAVSFAPSQLLDEETLDQINDNTVFLRDQSVDGLYQHGSGGGTSTGLKIVCGRNLVKPRKGDTASIQIRFNTFFTPESSVVVVASANTTRQTKTFITVEGIGRTVPNHTGFIANVNVDYAKERYDKIRTMYINWIAMGY